jgi:hypothetical protein
MTMRHFALVGFVLALVPLLAGAAEFRAGTQSSLQQGMTVNDDLYMVGGTVMSAGAVRGDLVASGGTLIVSGPVTGDALLGGGNITIVGQISDDLRAGGGNIVVQSTVNGDVVLGGGQVSLSGERVGGDVAIGGGSVRIDAAVGGDFKAGGGEIYINGPVGGDVEIHAEKVTLGPRANIAGNFTYKAAQTATMEEGAVVRGETSFTERMPREGTREGIRSAIATFITVWFIAKFLMLLAGAFALALIFKRYSHELVARATARPLLELGRGLVFFIVLPVLSVLLFVTVIGIPIGIIGLLTFAIVCIFVSLAAPIVLGSFVHKLIWKPQGYVVNWVSVLIGVVLYFILGIIPFIGWILSFVLMMITLGAMLNIKWSIAKEWR